MSGDMISGEEIQNIGPFHFKFGERSNKSSYKLSEMIFCKYEPTCKYWLVQDAKPVKELCLIKLAPSLYCI
jgi:hypothetical protein